MKNPDLIWIELLDKNIYYSDRYTVTKDTRTINPDFDMLESDYVVTPSLFRKSNANSRDWGNS